MLRILKDGKPISLKKQAKLVDAEGSIENCGRPRPEGKPATVPKPRHVGLRPVKPAKAKPKVKKSVRVDTEEVQLIKTDIAAEQEALKALVTKRKETKGKGSVKVKAEIQESINAVKGHIVSLVSELEKLNVD